jgi:predicted YcjX-like family ATPase
MASGHVTRPSRASADDDHRALPGHHLATLAADRHWPASTSRISQLRLTLEYSPRGFFARHLHGGRLHIDIVDYPGEWLLDLPLMRMTYAEWSAAAIAASREPPRAALARDWHAHLATLDPLASADESRAMRAAQAFTAYLARCRKDDVSLSTLPPGRFLMPGDLAGSPLLTFAPLDVTAGAEFPGGSLGRLMTRRYDSYVAKVVRPFFFGHFARLDRQIVLVDALTALNAGPAAVADAIGAVADSYTSQVSNSISSLFGVASTASSSPPPRPISCTMPVTTAWKISSA